MMWLKEMELGPVPEIMANAGPTKIHDQNLGVWQPAHTYDCRGTATLPTHLSPP